MGRTKVRFGTDYVLKGLLPKLVETRNVAVITDSEVARQLVGAKVFSFPAGEGSKTRETKAMLEDQLFAAGYGRDSCFVGVGGGVVTDLVGFLASTYCRGVPLILIPTTLMGMVDATIGGKTGVDTPYGKNLIGTFYPAEEVWIDVAFLETLPKKQILNGMAEIIKYGAVASKSLFEKMQSMSMLDLIFESVMVKKKIVEEDPLESKGRRRILNFGHTIGHALEKLEHYQIEHGQAVAIGMLVEGYMSPGGFHQLLKKIEEVRIPMKLQRKYTLQEILEAAALDKKAVNKMPRFVLLEEIGKAGAFGGEYCTTVDLKVLEKAIEWMNRTFT